MSDAPKSSRRRFFHRLGIGTVAVAATSVGTAPITMLWGTTKREINTPLCARCKEPLVLKGKNTTAVVSCSNEKCMEYWDDDLIERFYRVGKETGLSGELEDAPENPIPIPKDRR